PAAWMCTLSLHDALPIWSVGTASSRRSAPCAAAPWLSSSSRPRRRNTRLRPGRNSPSRAEPFPANLTRMSADASRARARAAEFAYGRLDRVRLARVPVAVRPWIVCCWVLTGVVAVVLLVPGLADEVAVEPGEAARILDRFLAPAWLRALLLVAAGMFAASSAVLALLRQAASTGDTSRVRREVALAVSVFPPLARTAERVVGPAALAGVAFVAFESVAHLGRPPRRRAALSGALAFVCWLVIAVTQFADVAYDWSWTVLFGLAAAFAAFGSY